MFVGRVFSEIISLFYLDLKKKNLYVQQNYNHVIVATLGICMYL